MLRRATKMLIALLYKAKYFSKCKLRASTNVLLRGCDFEGKNALGEHTYLSHTKLGYASYTGFGCEFSNTMIGRFCSIGNNVRVVSANHPLNMVSTHPAFYSTSFRFKYGNNVHFAEHILTATGYECEIGNDVWIGDNVLLKGGIKVDDGAVIAMGSIVVHDVPAYSIVAGVPAKIIKYRFDERTVQKLKQSKWWNESIEWFKNNASNFTSIDKFMENVQK